MDRGHWLCVLLSVLAFGGVLAGLIAYNQRGGRRMIILVNPPTASWLERPVPGEIWWADVPYSDGTGSKIRPVLIVRTHWTHVEVLPITSQDKRGRGDHVEVIGTEDWDPHAEGNSFIDLASIAGLQDARLVRRAGSCHPWVLKQAARHHQFGFVTYQN